MPVRCPCGTEFDPWEHETCPRCGDDQHVERPRTGARLVCANGHVAYRERVVAQPCPVCNEPLAEAAESERATVPPPPQDRLPVRGADVLKAEARLRFVAHAITARALFVVGWSYALLGLAIFPSLAWSFSATRLVVHSDEIPALAFVSFLGLWMAWDARRSLRGWPPARGVLCLFYFALAAHELLILLATQLDTHRRPALPFPWMLAGRSSSSTNGPDGIVVLGTLLLLFADVWVIAALRGTEFEFAFYFGTTREPLATTRAAREAAPGAKFGVPLFVLVATIVAEALLTYDLLG